MSKKDLENKVPFWIGTVFLAVRTFHRGIPPGTQTKNPPPTLGPSCPASAFGHPGAGGSLGFADPDRRIGFGYVMNKMDMGLTGDPRATALTDALYRCLG